MAKRRRKEEGEWAVPEFDEVEFMRKELRSARATILVVLWSLPAAGLSFGLSLANVAVVAFFAGLGMMLLLKWIMPILRVDTSQYKRKDWIGHGATFFFSWLAFWILLLNPPFADLTSPTIVAINVDGNSVGCGGTDTNTTGPNVLNVLAGDNIGVVRVTAGGANMSRSGNVWTRTMSPGSNIAIVAYDAAGHASPPCSININ